MNGLFLPLHGPNPGVRRNVRLMVQAEEIRGFPQEVS